MRNILVYKVVPGHVSDPVLLFSARSIIPTMLHTHLHVTSVVRMTKRQMGGAWEPSDRSLLPVFLLFL